MIIFKNTLENISEGLQKNSNFDYIRQSKDGETHYVTLKKICTDIHYYCVVINLTQRQGNI